MSLTGDCAAVIPCLNEAPTVAAVVRGVLGHLPAVWVVDDGSTDGTSSVARDSGAEVVRFNRSQGKGDAIRAGIVAAGARGFRWILLLDGDGQHAVEDIPHLITAAEQTGVEMLIGNRMPQSEAIPWLRRQVNRWMSRDLSRWTGLDVPDTQCGFRLIQVAAWNAVLPQGSGFLIESSMLVAFAAAGYRVGHAPVRVLPRTRGQSRIRSLRDTVRWLRWRRKARREFRRQPVLAGGTVPGSGRTNPSGSTGLGRLGSRLPG